MTEENGLTLAYIFDGQGGARRIDWEQVNSWSPEQGVLWLHLDYTCPEVKEWLKNNSGLDAVTSKAMLAKESRPRTVVAPDGLLVFLRAVNLNHKEAPQDLVSIRIWVDGHRIITTGRHKLQSINLIETALQESHGPKTPTQFLSILTSHMLDRIQEVVESIDEEADDLIEAVLTHDSGALRTMITTVRHKCTVIRRYLAPQKEALNKLYRDSTPFLGEEDRVHAREADDRIVRYIEELDSARERAMIIQEELTNKLSEQMNNRMYVLSVVTVIFLPLTFITGLLGINVGGIPGSSYRWAFWIITAVLLGSLSVALWLAKRKKWI